METIGIIAIVVVFGLIVWATTLSGGGDNTMQHTSRWKGTKDCAVSPRAVCNGVYAIATWHADSGLGFSVGKDGRLFDGIIGEAIISFHRRRDIGTSVPAAFIVAPSHKDDKVQENTFMLYFPKDAAKFMEHWGVELLTSDSLGFEFTSISGEQFKFTFDLDGVVDAVRGVTLNTGFPSLVKVNASMALALGDEQ